MCGLRCDTVQSCCLSADSIGKERDFTECLHVACCHVTVLRDRTVCICGPELLFVLDRIADVVGEKRSEVTGLRGKM